MYINIYNQLNDARRARRIIDETGYYFLFINLYMYD